MAKPEYAFPWGVYVGDFIDGEYTIPLCLDSKVGGFCVLFDDDSEQISTNLIENVVLKLFEVMPLGSIVTDVFDFGKKRFMHLSTFGNAKLYNIAYSPNTASSRFNELEEVFLDRHHNLLSFATPTLSEYNVKHTSPEAYHIILINLDDFPDDMTSYKRVKNFFDSAYEAGFYTIAFANRSILDTEVKATKFMLDKFPHLDIVDKIPQIIPELFTYIEMSKLYEFEYVNDNKDKIVKSLLEALEKDKEEGSEHDFLSIPIGTSVDGHHKVEFTLGKRSMNYNAFITGMTGTGKSNLLNSIILGIAEKYAPKEIELYLMDYKLGTEFGIYEKHPNCREIFLDNQDLAAAVRMMESFVSTMNQREKLFKEVGVSDIDAYNILKPDDSLPRKILIIDEVQQLFSNSFKEQKLFNDLLEKIVRLGRSFGLHIILSTQSLVGVNINDAIMLQIGLRISFRLSKYNEASKIFSDRNIDDVMNLRREKYEFIYNSDIGSKEANIKAKASYIDKNSIRDTIERICNDRSQEEILVPKVVRSVDEDIIVDDEIIASVITKKPEERSDAYSTSAAKDFLEKLRNEGKIK